MTGPEVLKARYLAGPPAMIVAHRGAWDAAPENSRAAIRAAAPFDIVEIDGRVAADGGVVLMHDETLLRTTGDTRAVAGVPADEIRALRLRHGGGGPGAAVSEERVPGLAEALAAGPGLLFDLDAKNPAEAEAIARAAVAAGAADRAAVKVDVADANGLADLAALEARIGLAVMAKLVLRDAASLALVEAVAAADVVVAEVWFDNLDLLREAARIGGDELLLATYTLDPVHCAGLSDSRAAVDPGAVWGRLLDAGIRIIMTDRPAALRDYLEGPLPRSA